MTILQKMILVAVLMLAPCAAWAMTDFSRVRIGITHRRELENMVGKPLAEIFPGSMYTYAIAHYLVNRAEVLFNQAGRIESLALIVRGGVSKKIAIEMFRLGATYQTMHDISGNLVEVYPPQGALVTYAGTGDNADVVRVTFVDSVILEIVRPIVRVMYPDAYVYGMGVDVDQSKEGVRVTKVYPRSAAQDADILAGDVIVELDGQMLNHADDAEKFKQVIATHPVLVPTEFYVKRGKDLQWKAITFRSLTPEEEYSQFCRDIGDKESYTAGLFFPTRDRCLFQFTPGMPYRKDIFPFEVGQHALFDRYVAFKQSDDLAARESFLKALLPATLFSSDLSGVFPVSMGSVSADAWDIVKGYAVVASAANDFALASETLIRVVDACPKDFSAILMLAFVSEKAAADQTAVTYYRVAESLTSDVDLKSYIESRLRALHVTIE